ncbi:caspase family protein [Schlesneria paludicola]|uniref:caspase family protein n=1 Tax=Schlesneria paludicola TaxID=360056 RepID=UPI0012F9A2E8|nr:caspase family protein [Schlesneria paludicola]
MRKSVIRFLVMAAFFSLSFVRIAIAQSAGPISGSSTEKFALLVGCSEYVNIEGRNLKGPTNDVRAFGQALVTQFGFPPTEVRQLVGWPDDLSKRPTRENIVREFQSLIDRVTPDSQVAIYLSGHGTRVALPEFQSDPLDPKNVELDGYDEAFVAADAKAENGELKNLILDNEFGDWLDAMQAKGAHVWILFDCCHSGTMARGADDENPRELLLSQIGLTAQSGRPGDGESKTTPVAKPPAVADQLGEGDGMIDSRVQIERKGSLVAFYAAQPFETAPDLPCPMNAPPARENYFGLLTYTTLQTLLNERGTSTLTYRELGNIVQKRYQKERGTRGPTPSFSGALDREILGQHEWRGRSQFTLKLQEGQWIVNTGELQGITTGSIFAVYPPAGTTSSETLVGHVRVVSASPTSVRVEPCEYDQRPAMPTETLTELMECKVVTRAVGDFRIRLALNAPHDDLKSLGIVAQKVVESVSAKISEFVEFVRADQQSQTDLELHAVTPREAEDLFHIKIPDVRILMTSPGELRGEPVARESCVASERPKGRVPHVYQIYDPNDGALFRAALESDLLKFFSWRQLWRLSGRLAGSESSTSSDIKVELCKIEGPQDETGGKPFDGSSVDIGQHLELRVKNESADRVWITLIFLNSNCLIDVLPAEQLNRLGSVGDSLQPFRFRVSSSRSGRQAWLVIASSAEIDRQQPDFRFLSQSGLGRSTKQISSGHRASTSPFESLVQAIAGQKQTFRGESLPATGAAPTLIMRSWNAISTSDKPLESR